MKHIDAASHVRGESQYIDDMPLPANMLYAAVFTSPTAHGEIERLHLETARRMAGVVSILTADDIPGDNQIGPLIQDEPLLATDSVHFAGQPVAVVVAERPEIAHKAVRAIEIELAELPVIVDPLEAFEQGEIIGTPRTFALGDVDRAWQDCEAIVEDWCEIGGQEHVYLETQRARALPLEGGDLMLYASTQSPYAAQRAAARILNVPHHRIQVEVKRLGGGFGGKEDQATPWACMAALAAWQTGRPVELVLSRADDLKMTGKRHPYKSHFKIGATKEGKILAYEVKHYQNAGAAADLSPAVLERTLFHSTNSYFIPNVRAVGVSCRTNLPPNTAFRGFGGPQGMFVMESAISKIAEALNLPREEIQQKNLLQEGDLYPYGQRVSDDHIQRVWQRASEKYDLPGQRKRVTSFNANHFEIKKGVAVMPVNFGISFTATHLNQASALVHVYTDGSVSVTTGGVEMGQGLYTNIAKIAAQTFGIGLDRIKVESTNTTRIANMSPSAASSTTLLNGNATELAVNQILERLKKHAIKQLKLPDTGRFEVPPSPLLVTIEDERVLFDGHETGMTWEQLVAQAYMARTSLSAHAFYATPAVWFDKVIEKGKPFAYHVCGVAVIEITLDCLRGVYDLDSVKIVHDLGRPLSELVDRGQIEGGLAQGLGWMTMEDLQYDDKGNLLSGALATYKVPDAYFMPDEIDITYLEHAESKHGPYGSKAVGEPPLMYGIGAFFAIQDAMRAFKPEGAFTFHAPMTPERVLMELEGDRVKEFELSREVVNGNPVDSTRAEVVKSKVRLS